jgi:anti-sigma regulatory factor (Ser/Thr protein kinase)
MTIGVRQWATVWPLMSLMGPPACANGCKDCPKARPGVCAGIRVISAAQAGPDNVLLGSGAQTVNSICAPQAPHPVTRKECGSVAPDEAEAWPLKSHLELAALPTAVSCARRHAKAVVLECGLPMLADTVELIVSEIVTNAVQAASFLRADSLATPVVRLWLASDLHCVLVRVWDSSSQMPARQDPNPDDESGRGLMLVDCLGSEWGVDRRQNGKVVWVIVK